MRISELKIGDLIRDIEDGDCLFEGVIVSLNPIQYEVKRIIWDGCKTKEDDFDEPIIGLQWYWLEVLRDGKFIKVEQ